MIKILQSMLVLSIFAAPLSGQNFRRVMVEEFTQASCPPCAVQNPPFNATLDANAQFVTAIKYQTSWPGVDPMNAQTAPEVATRVSFYGVGGVPAGFANGTQLASVGGYSAAQIQTQYNSLTPVKIDVQHRITPALDSIYITVEVGADAAVSGDLRLMVGVTEREILFVNAPGTNGEKEFYDVMRKMLPGAGGTTTGSFAAGEKKTYEFSWALRNIYNLNEIKVVAWLQDFTTKAIWQSNLSEPQHVADGIGMDIDLRPSATTKFLCSSQNTYLPQIEFVNSGADTLRSAQMEFRVGAFPAWTAFNWTGAVAPGEKAVIEMPQINIGSTTSYRFRILGTNLGTQTNTVDPAILYTYLRMGTVFNPPVLANFQTGGVVPNGWVSQNLTNGWTLATNAGGFGQSSQSASIKFYDLANGTVDLFMPRVNLSSYTDAVLRFDHAYAYYVGNGATLTDTFQIDVSTDCAQTWTTIFKAGGVELATAPPASAAFVPTASQWLANELSLGAYNGTSEVTIRFRGISGYGNNFYIDNINVSGQIVSTTDIDGLEGLSVWPNPTSDQLNIQFDLEEGQPMVLSVYNMLGQMIEQQPLGTVPAGTYFKTLQTASWQPGQYVMVLQGKNGLATMRVQKN